MFYYSRRRKRDQRAVFRWGLFGIGLFAVMQVGMHSIVSRQQQAMQHHRNPLDSVSNDHYRSLEELQDRASRFPSVEARLKLYMSSWYLPPCSATDRIIYDRNHALHVVVRAPSGEEIALSKKPEHSKHLFRFDQAELEHGFESNNDRFCEDALKYYLPSIKRLKTHESSMPPLILQFGDAEEWIDQPEQTGNKTNYPKFPVLKKFRYALDQSQVHSLTEKDYLFSPQCRTQETRFAQAAFGPLHTQAIITIVSNTHRHFGPISTVRALDIAWSQKMDMAVFRGGLTGRNHRTMRHDRKDQPTPRQLCEEIARCNFVLAHTKSRLVDAKLVEIKKGKDLDLRVIDGEQIFGASLSMHEMLKYKIIVMFEGNDVSTGLKWALFSNSVVLMKRPTRTSWAMEELLEPYVHYVPIEDDDITVDEKVEWILEHEAMAQAIARRGQMWIYDLLFHPYVEQETITILDETLRRYMSHFEAAATEIRSS